MGHLTKWLFFNLMFGAIPYALVVALNHLQPPGSSLLHPSSEVLFIGVVATSSALGELWDVEDHWTRPRSSWRGHLQLFLLLGLLMASLLYGAYVYHSLMSPGRASAVDCAAVVSEVGGPQRPRPDPGFLVRWVEPCGEWAAVQARFFLISLWLTGGAALASTIAVYMYSDSRGGRRHGMV
jgi:hypothetical protein